MCEFAFLFFNEEKKRIFNLNTSWIMDLIYWLENVRWKVNVNNTILYVKINVFFDIGHGFADN